jgi:hypothetical protein
MYANDFATTSLPGWSGQRQLARSTWAPAKIPGRAPVKPANPSLPRRDNVGDPARCPSRVQGSVLRAVQQYATRTRTSRPATALNWAYSYYKARHPAQGLQPLAAGVQPPKMPMVMDCPSWNVGWVGRVRFQHRRRRCFGAELDRTPTATSGKTANVSTWTGTSTVRPARSSPTAADLLGGVQDGSGRALTQWPMA